MRRPYSNLFERLLANSFESEIYFYGGTPCWEWKGYRSRGRYARVNIRTPGNAHPHGVAAHRAMAEIVLDRKLHPDRETVEHLCEVSWCVNFLHFALATRSDNTADMRARRHGKSPRKIFKPLVDLDLYFVDRFIRSLPVLKSELMDAECPF